MPPPVMLRLCCQCATWLTGLLCFVLTVVWDVLCHWTTLWGDTLPVSSPLLYTWKVRQTIPVMPSVRKLCLKKNCCYCLLICCFLQIRCIEKRNPSLHSVSCSSEHCKTKCVPDETSLWEPLSKYVSGFPIFFFQDPNDIQCFMKMLIKKKNITRHPL